VNSLTYLLITSKIKECITNLDPNIDG